MHLMHQWVTPVATVICIVVGFDFEVTQGNLSKVSSNRPRSVHSVAKRDKPRHLQRPPVRRLRLRLHGPQLDDTCTTTSPSRQPPPPPGQEVSKRMGVNGRQI